jgi:uncharacterized lipoprotein YajG
MKALFALAAIALLAGCATTENQMVASAECKVTPVTTESVTAVRKPEYSHLQQVDAQMQLAASNYRRSNLQQNAYNMNNVEDSLRDCQRAEQQQH